MSGLTAETLYLPVFTILSIIISYLAVSIVLTKLSQTGVLNPRDGGSWVTTINASQRSGFFADLTHANKLVMVNLNEYSNGWELGFPFSLFDPSLVTEGTSLTIYNSPASSVGSTLRVTYTNKALGVLPGSDQEACDVLGQTSCKCPNLENFCKYNPDCGATGTNGNNGDGQCNQCKCSQVCNPKLELKLFATLGRGQGITVVVQRRIPNINLTQTGSCFYKDLTPQELQPRDWVPVLYHAPDINDSVHGGKILQCSGYNNFTAVNPSPPTIIQPIRSGNRFNPPKDAGNGGLPDPGNNDSSTNLCFGYLVASNTSFSDNIPSAFTGRYRQNGPSADTAVPPNSKYNTQWQDCMAINCKCAGTQVGVWCETP